jgi:hypothetical protein
MQVGKSHADQTANETVESREITKKIMEFGVTQQQILRIIYLLSLELEDHQAMLEISSSVKNYLENLTENAKTESKIIVQ